MCGFKKDDLGLSLVNCESLQSQVSTPGQGTEAEEAASEMLRCSVCGALSSECQVDWGFGLLPPLGHSSGLLALLRFSPFPPILRRASCHPCPDLPDHQGGSCNSGIPTTSQVLHRIPFFKQTCQPRGWNYYYRHGGPKGSGHLPKATP